MILEFAKVSLVVLHMIDGRSVTINSAHVTRMSETRDDQDEDKQLAAGIRCVIYLSDGRYVSVVETCGEVLRLMKGDKL